MDEAFEEIRNVFIGNRGGGEPSCGEYGLNTNCFDYYDSEGRKIGIIPYFKLPKAMVDQAGALLLPTKKAIEEELKHKVFQNVGDDVYEKPLVFSTLRKFKLAHPYGSDNYLIAGIWGNGHEISYPEGPTSFSRTARSCSKTIKVSPESLGLEEQVLEELNGIFEHSSPSFYSVDFHGESMGEALERAVRAHEILATTPQMIEKMKRIAELREAGKI